jgi:peptidyl-prolyl cis-trans isomerase C
MKTIPVLGLVCLLAACAREPEHARAQARDLASESSPLRSVPVNPGAPLVEVNGVVLTVGDAHIRIESQLAVIRGRIPPTEIDTVRRRLLANTIDQFIMRRLLLDEAARLGIEASQAEKDQAYDAIREKLPEGMTLEQVMLNSPMGEDQMREEVVAGITVNKVLTRHASNVVNITEEEVDAFYATHAEKLTLPETVHARHILIAIPDGADTAAVEAKHELAESIREALAGGADFAELARKHSDCPSRERGGDLGEFPRGKMVPEFDSAAFALSENELSPVIRTKFGFHIIDVISHNQAGRMPRQSVVQILKQRQQQAVLQEYIDHLKKDASITYHAALSNGPIPAAATPEE